MIGRKSVKPVKRGDISPREQALERLKAWVRSTGRKIAANEQAFRYEIRLSFNAEWQLLEPGDMDSLVALAKQLGDAAETRDYQILFANATRFARTGPPAREVEEALAGRYLGLSERDRDDIRLRSQAYRGAGGAAA